MIVGGNWRFGVEAESTPRDAQALVRRLALKERVSQVDGVILVLPRTRRSRVFLHDAAGTLVPSLPGSGDRTIELLRVGIRPPDSAVVCI
jgi:hypothetical protein